jgi:hypothetical protein
MGVRPVFAAAAIGEMVNGQRGMVKREERILGTGINRKDAKGAKFFWEVGFNAEARRSRRRCRG